MTLEDPRLTARLDALELALQVLMVNELRHRGGALEHRLRRLGERLLEECRRRSPPSTGADDTLRQETEAALDALIEGAISTTQRRKT